MATTMNSGAAANSIIASHWTREQAIRFEATEANTFPELDISQIKPFMKGMTSAAPSLP